MAEGMGGSILSGAASGAGTGLSLGGPWGAAIGALGGGLMGFISKNQADKANQNIEDLIDETPDFRESDAYTNAANQAARADRWAQQGLSSQTMNRAEQGIGRVGGAALSNATNLQSGLMGMAGTTRSLTDAYTDLAVQDADAQRANRASALTANRNLQLAQEDAFGMDLGKHQNMLNLALGETASDRTDMLGAQQSMGTGVQNLLNSPEAMEQFGGFSKKIGGFMSKLFGGGKEDAGDDGTNMIPPAIKTTDPFQSFWDKRNRGSQITFK